MDNLLPLTFSCPHCARPTVKWVCQEVRRARIEYDCCGEKGGCGKTFQLLYLRDDGTVTTIANHNFQRLRIADQ
jgi:hypothetical protein